MSATATAQPVRYKRSLKNYLLDSRFQLKYTSMIIVVALVISGFLGIFLWKTSTAMVRESQKVMAESKKVSDVVRMGMAKEYADSPDLLKNFNEESAETDKKIEAQQQALIQNQQNMIYSLVGGLGLMVLLIGVLGIYFTHKVVGPIHMMKNLLRQVGNGKLNFNRKPRKGDELIDFFEVFVEMVQKLKDRQRNEVEQLEIALAVAKEAGAPLTSLEKIAGVRDEMKAALDV
jgi:signal transduction histidine kinase